jgi:integrase
MQFTEMFIKSLKPEADKRFTDVREKSGKGFGITVFPSGEKSFIFIYHFAGRKRRMTLGKYPHCSLADARRLHRGYLKMLEGGKDPALTKRREQAEARDSITVQDLIKEYLEKWAKPRKRSWQADERLLNKDVKPIWGKHKAKDITRRDVILLLDKIKERGAPIQANRTLACVRRMFNFAVERDIITASPCAAVKAVAKERRRERMLSTAEIKNLWNGLDEPDLIEPCPIKADAVKIVHQIKMSDSTKLALKLQLATAQRKGEIIGAEWNEMDLEAGWWTIPAAKAKNGNTHRVPLSTLALELLNEVKNLSGNSRWLFPSAKGDKPVRGEAIDHAVRRCTFKDVKPFTPHDLRRTAATHMTSMGISRLVVSKLLNHVENSVTAVYDRHSYDAEKKHALELWGTSLKMIISSTAALKSNVYTLQSIA